MPTHRERYSPHYAAYSKYVYNFAFLKRNNFKFAGGIVSHGEMNSKKDCPHMPLIGGGILIQLNSDFTLTAMLCYLLSFGFVSRFKSGDALYPLVTKESMSYGKITLGSKGKEASISIPLPRIFCCMTYCPRFMTSVPTYVIVTITAPLQMINSMWSTLLTTKVLASSCDVHHRNILFYTFHNLLDLRVHRDLAACKQL